jgi:hypothetical protein
LAGTAAAAAALGTGPFDLASALLAQETQPQGTPGAGKPKVTVLFLQREKGSNLDYPTGTTEQLREIRELHLKTIRDGAARFAVDLDIAAEPGMNVASALEQVKKAAPYGLLIVGNGLYMRGQVGHLVKNRGDIPTIVFSNVCHFIPDYVGWSKPPRTFVAATEDIAYLATALRMFRALWDMEHLKLLRCPTADWRAEYQKTAESDELRAIAESYIKGATRVVEPTREHVLEAVKNYVTIRRLMEANGCNGVAVSGELCIRAKPPHANPACLAVSRLLDDGIPAACQGDEDSAKCMRLMLSLTGRTGFMGNTCADTVNNTLTISHCTSSLKLEGPAEPYRVPYMLRDLHAMGGVSMMAAWPVGREVTVVDLHGKDVIVGEGRVVANTEQIAQPPCGGCRTSVDIAVDGLADVLAVKCQTLHHYVVLGRYLRPVVHYCKLAGLKAFDLTATTQYA